MKKINTYNRGFGLIEVLITAVLLIIITGSVIGLSRTIVRNNIVSTERTQAYNLLRQRIENIIATRNTNWDQGKVWDTTLNDQPIIKQTIDNIEYTITTDISDSGNALADDLHMDTSEYLDSQAKTITITVSWDDGSKNYDVTDATILTNWKPQL